LSELKKAGHRYYNMSWVYFKVMLQTALVEN